MYINPKRIFCVLKVAQVVNHGFLLSAYQSVDLWTLKVRQMAERLGL